MLLQRIQVLGVSSGKLHGETRCCLFRSLREVPMINLIHAVTALLACTHSIAGSVGFLGWPTSCLMAQDLAMGGYGASESQPKCHQSAARGESLPAADVLRLIDQMPSLYLLKLMADGSPASLAEANTILLDVSVADVKQVYQIVYRLRHLTEMELAVLVKEVDVRVYRFKGDIDDLKRFEERERRVCILLEGLYQWPHELAWVHAPDRLQLPSPEGKLARIHGAVPVAFQMWESILNRKLPRRHFKEVDDRGLLILR
jgi:hypothetical protein